MRNSPVTLVRGGGNAGPRGTWQSPTPTSILSAERKPSGAVLGSGAGEELRVSLGDLCDREPRSRITATPWLPGVPHWCQWAAQGCGPSQWQPGDPPSPAHLQAAQDAMARETPTGLAVSTFPSSSSQYSPAASIPRCSHSAFPTWCQHILGRAGTHLLYLPNPKPVPNRARHHPPAQPSSS